MRIVRIAFFPFLPPRNHVSWKSFEKLPVKIRGNKLPRLSHTRHAGLSHDDAAECGALSTQCKLAADCLCAEADDIRSANVSVLSQHSDTGDSVCPSHVTASSPHADCTPLRASQRHCVVRSFTR